MNEQHEKLACCVKISALIVLCRKIKHNSQAIFDLKIPRVQDWMQVTEALGLYCKKNYRTEETETNLSLFYVRVPLHMSDISSHRAVQLAEQTHNSSIIVRISC